jgi:hypothetical protein
VLFRCFVSASIAAVLSTPLQASAQTLQPGGVEDRGPDATHHRGWHALTGLRVEQWIAPTDDHLRFDVRVRLPEMALGEHFSVETFNWERLDVAEGRSGRNGSGTVYHLLGARYRRDAGPYAFFVGAHLLSWSGRGRPVTPWLGLRLGEADGMAIESEVHLLGLGPHGEVQSPLDDADITVAVDGPMLGACRLGARGRARDVRHPDRHQREQMMSLGVEFDTGRRRLFLGLGVQHQMRRAVAPDAPTADRMLPAPVGYIDTTAIMLHLDAETALRF